MKITHINPQEFLLVTIKDGPLGDDVCRRYPDGRWSVRRDTACPVCDTCNWIWCTDKQSSEFERTYRRWLAITKSRRRPAAAGASRG